ncbi:MAG: rane protein of unknown function [Propionibacteriaceae bacterium]|nr:rane protein of unknown function [Propionibacteriaceae bacterium]
MRTAITAVIYVALFAVANVVIQIQPLPVRQAWLDWASTDLVNLGDHPVASMIISAFVDDSGFLAWIGLGLIGLVAAGHTLGNLRCAVLVTVAHVVATAVSEGVLAVRIALGSVPPSERVSLDIGPSYVVVAALSAAMAYGNWPTRIPSGVAFALLAPHLFGGLGRLDVGPVGHCCAIVIGLVGGCFLHRGWRAAGQHQMG